MPDSPSVSIILRTKNEERWITPCFKSIFDQTFRDFEIIVVDNESTDKTIAKIRQFPVQKIFTIEDYFPGKALNLGIKNSVGKYLVFLSAHCIPVANTWLDTLVKTLEEDPNFAGVYGRQEPMSFTTPSDKRDLLLVFGLDRKIQRKDSFFHNANSIVRRVCWESVPFDPTVTNIEDRIWGQEMITRGYSLLYEPSASVYHYHGIHQDGHLERLQNVVRIIETQKNYPKVGRIDAESLNILAIIPVRGEVQQLAGRPKLLYSIEAARKSRYINTVVVSTDLQTTADIARAAGAECPFVRPPQLSEAHVNLQAVQKYSLEKLEENGYLPDLIVHLEETFPFREVDLLDKMILRLVEEGHDSVIAARPESGWMWHEEQDHDLKRIDSGDVPREFKEKTLVGLHGLGCITHPEFIRSGGMLGPKTALYEVNYLLAGFEVRDQDAARFASLLVGPFFQT